MRHTLAGTRLCALAILIALAFPLTSRAQGRLSGRVLAGESGQPLANAIVRLRSVADSSRELADTTPPSGEYRFDVPAGSYTVRASVGGRVAASAEVSLVDGPEAVVDLTLPPETRASIGARVPLVNSRNFNLTEPNYFLFGFEDFTGGNPVAPGVYANQVKFRIAIRYRLVTVLDSLHDSGLYVAYRQNSFWYLWEESAPFFDNDYNPQMFVYYDSRDYSHNAFAPSFRAFVEHESNGREGVASRSWNRYGLGMDFGDYNQTLLYGGVRGWQAFSVAPENPDIKDFEGRGEVVVNVQPLVWRGLYLGDLGFAARLRVDGKPFWTNSELNVYVGSRVLCWIPGLAGLQRLNASVMLQRFSGTGEDLLTYRQKRTVTRIGLATVR
jgi:phospholipase A1/A2